MLLTDDMILDFKEGGRKISYLRLIRRPIIGGLQDKGMTCVEGPAFSIFQA